MFYKHSQPNKMEIKKKRIITIGGTSGCGKSGTVRRLHQVYQMYKHFSTGDAVRAMAAEAGIPIEEFNEYNKKNGKSFDETIDGMLKDISEAEDFYLIDSRLGVCFVPNSFKVLLIVDPYVGAKRRLHDYQKADPIKYKDTTVEEIMETIKKRDLENHERYMSKYCFDINDESKYDLVIDTTHESIEEVCEKIQRGYTEWLKIPYLEIVD